MSRMSQRIPGAGVCVLVFAASIAAGQAPARVRGVIDNVDGKTLSAKTRDGAMVQIKLTEDARVLTLDKKMLPDVKQGSFVGITAMPQPDGSQKAAEIHIFPEAMRATWRSSVTPCRANSCRTNITARPATRSGYKEE